MSDFDEWWQEKRKEAFIVNQLDDARIYVIAAWNHQQERIDELEGQLEIAKRLMK